MRAKQGLSTGGYMKKSSLKKKEGKSFTVTKADQRREIEEGVEEEFTLKPGRHIFAPARQLATPSESSPRQAKVRITMYLDADILEHFKQRARHPHAAPYQKQINDTLREAVGSQEKSSASKSKIEVNTADALLQDKGFIEAVAQSISRLNHKSHRHGQRIA